MRPLTAWLGRALSGASGSPSTARVGYLSFVAFGGLWLTIDLVASILRGDGLSNNWVTAFGVYATTCTAGYVGGKVAGRPPRADGGGPRESGQFTAPGGA